MEEAKYNITNKEFKQISKWAEDVYNIAVIVDYFVGNQPEIEECYNLAPEKTELITSICLNIVWI